MTTTATAAPPRGLPKTYASLVALLPPRPIHDEVDLENATEMIDRLAGHELNADQEDYLEALSTFVEAYEADLFPPEGAVLTPLGVLRELLSQHGMTASDMGRLLGNRTLGPAILSGRRGLSKAHIRRLAEHFKVDAGLFL
jgi:HTH-type transcriptional regulator/antitoxin HigA